MTGAHTKAHGKKKKKKPRWMTQNLGCWGSLIMTMTIYFNLSHIALAAIVFFFVKRDFLNVPTK